MRHECLFIFSSRRRHTRCYRDWSSDVCSSDLPVQRAGERDHGVRIEPARREHRREGVEVGVRSEERRVGKECRSRWPRYHEKKKKKKERQMEAEKFVKAAEDAFLRQQETD